LTEGRATGISTIIKIMRNNGSPDPIFETDEDRTWFRVTLPIHPDFIQIEDELVNEPDVVENVVEKRLSLILKLMKENPAISKKALAAITNLNQRTIDRDIQKLKEEGFIERIGPAKGGYWKVTDTKQP
jgi:ATP-dependent DNA helicase RecG